MSDFRIPREVLIVVSDEKSRNIIERVIENAGHNTSFATAWEDAVYQIREFPPHLLIMDATLFDANRDSLQSLFVDRFPKAIMLFGSHKEFPVERSILKPIEAPKLSLRISQILKENEIPSFDFKESEQPEVEIRTKGRITEANEASLILEIPVRLKELSTLQISSPFLDELGCSGSILIRTETQAQFKSESQFKNEISLVALNPNATDRIRKTLMGWRGK